MSSPSAADWRDLPLLFPTRFPLAPALADIVADGDPVPARTDKAERARQSIVLRRLG
jgi:hypothetical protein